MLMDDRMLILNIQRYIWWGCTCRIIIIIIPPQTPKSSHCSILAETAHQINQICFPITPTNLKWYINHIFIPKNAKTQTLDFQKNFWQKFPFPLQKLTFQKNFGKNSIFLQFLFIFQCYTSNVPPYHDDHIKINCITNLSTHIILTDHFTTLCLGRLNPSFFAVFLKSSSTCSVYS